MNRQIYRIIVVIFALLSVVSCGTDDAPVIGDVDNGYGSGYDGLAVGVENGEELEMLSPGTSLGVFTFADNSYTLLSANVRLTVGEAASRAADSGFSLSEALGICAYSPYSEAWTDADVTNDLLFRVIADQREEESFLANDLMVAPFTYINSGRVTLRFRRVMAKVSIRVVNRTGSFDLSGAEVSLPSRRSEVFVSLLSGKSKVSLDTKTDINAFILERGADTLAAAAVLLPESIGAGIVVFTLDVNGHRMTYASVRNENWESGKEYTYEMELTERGLISTGCQVVDWNDGNGNTELDVPMIG